MSDRDKHRDEVACRAELPPLKGPQCGERYTFCGEVVRCLLEREHAGRCLVDLWSRP